jgi:hypothetical protein
MFYQYSSRHPDGGRQHDPNMLVISNMESFYPSAYVGFLYIIKYLYLCPMLTNSGIFGLILLKIQTKKFTKVSAV